MNPIENPAWMTDSEERKKREAREIDQVLGWVLSGENSLPDGTTKEGMATSQKIEFLRQLEDDPKVSEENLLHIRTILKEISENKFEHE